MRSAFFGLAVAITRAPRAAASWTSRPPATPPAPWTTTQPAPAAPVDDAPAAPRDPESLTECLSRSERRNRKRAAGFPGRLWRSGRDGRRRGEHLLRPRPVTAERQRMCHHLVALAPPAPARPGRCARPARRRPERHRRRAADLPAADPDKVVPVADAGGDDVDQDLACGRRRRLVHLEDLDRLAECCDPSRAHLFAARYACPSCAGPLWHLARGL